MKINFKQITINNFMSIGQGKISLENRGYTLIEGVNNNLKDNALSNGSGKSSCFNALCYCLTGETIQGVSSNLKNIYNEGDMKVELEFSIDKDNFKVIRGRDIKDKAFLKLFINNEDKSGKTLRESEDQLKKYLSGLTSELLGEVIIIGQGMPHKFSNNTPSGRKEILEKLSNNDIMLYDIKERVEKRLAELNNKKAELTTTKTTLETKQLLFNKQKEENEKKLEELVKSSNTDFNKEIQNIEINIKELQTQQENLKKDLDSKEDNYFLQSQVSINITEKETKEIAKEESLFKQYNDPIINELNEAKANLLILNKDITRLSSITDICPTCHQKIQGVHKPDLTEQYKERERLNKLITELNDKNNKQKEAYKLNYEEIKNAFKKELNKLQESLNKQKTEINLAKQNYNNITIDLNKKQTILNNLKKEKEILSSKVEETTEAIKVFKKDLELIASDLLYNIKEIDNIQAHLDIVNKINTYVKRDFRGVLLSNVISYINVKSKEYAKEIFGNEDIEFTLNGNNIDIKYSNKPLDNLSGGEQQKVDLIIQFAIRSMMQEYTGFNSNIIVLDEILDNLDVKGCDQVINFITNRLSDIESVFIISHHADSLNICNDSTIKVIKNDKGVSYINEE